MSGGVLAASLFLLDAKNQFLGFLGNLSYKRCCNPSKKALFSLLHTLANGTPLSFGSVLPLMFLMAPLKRLNPNPTRSFLKIQAHWIPLDFCTTAAFSGALKTLLGFYLSIGFFPSTQHHCSSSHLQVFRLQQPLYLGKEGFLGS